MKTGAFKECEAYAVCARINDLNDKVMVVASAGNTARAFARVCSENNIPLLLCIPQDCIDAMWSAKPLNPCVKLVATERGSDYFDAIYLSNIICELDKFYPEGGAKNVARPLPRSDGFRIIIFRLSEAEQGRSLPGRQTNGLS